MAGCTAHARNGHIFTSALKSDVTNSVASLGRGRTTPGDTIQGDTRMKKIVAEFTKNTVHVQHDVGRWELCSCDETTA